MGHSLVIYLLRVMELTGRYRESPKSPTLNVSVVRSTVKTNVQSLSFQSCLKVVRSGCMHRPESNGKISKRGHVKQDYLVPRSRL